MIKMEVLYPEYMNLYGDRGNIKYLEQIIPKLKIIYTSLKEEPHFIKNNIDILYIGPTTENNQEEVAEILNKYKKEIKKLIDNNVFILATGNAIEYFGNYIEKLENTKINCLGLYDVYSKRIENLRYNENVIDTVFDIEVVGFKNQLSHMYGEDKHCIINNTTNKIDFIIDNNFIGTYLLGPILVLNPIFLEYILKKINIKYENIHYEDALKAYNKRLNEFKSM